VRCAGVAHALQPGLGARVRRQQLGHRGTLQQQVQQQQQQQQLDVPLLRLGVMLVHQLQREDAGKMVQIPINVTTTHQPAPS
jgi:hypothetical protein